MESRRCVTPNFKIKHWCGLTAKNGGSSSPVLVFYHFMQGKRMPELHWLREIDAKREEWRTERGFQRVPQKASVV